MSECNCKTESCVSCAVKDCIHHTENDKCDAGNIHVGNMSAKCCTETCCDTFQSKS